MRRSSRPYLLRILSEILYLRYAYGIARSCRILMESLWEHQARLEATIRLRIQIIPCDEINDGVLGFWASTRVVTVAPILTGRLNCKLWLT